MELKSIFSEFTEHELGGIKIHIKQICLDDLPYVVDIFSKTTGKKESLNSKIIGLISSDFPLVKSMIVRLTNISEADVGKISVATIVFVVSKIVEENATFLQQVVAPMVEATAARLNGLTKSKS